MVSLFQFFEYNYNYNYILNDYYKLANHSEFPFELNLVILYKENLVLIDDNYKYKLKSIILHSGEAKIWHYYAIIRDNIEVIWIKYNGKYKI